MKRVGRAPTLVLCSRNARPKKGLVRRPHVDQHGCPSHGEKLASLEGSIVYGCARSMRAGEITPAVSLGEY